jgi:hypothetical protein
MLKKIFGPKKIDVTEGPKSFYTMQTAIICAVITFYYLLIRAGSKRNWETDICRDQGLNGTIELKYIYI